MMERSASAHTLSGIPSYGEAFGTSITTVVQLHLHVHARPMVTAALY